MLGQEKFISKIDHMIDVGFPHSVLILGDYEAGQLDVCKYISTKLGTPMIDITEKISVDTINQVQMSPDKTVYIVNVSTITEKEQNILLKVFEEPNALVYIMLYGTYNDKILPTILNRAIILKMDKYSEEILLKYTNNRALLEICSTPKQVEVAMHTNLETLVSLCENIVTRMARANFYNALTIADKINFADEPNKFDIYLFYKVLTKKCLEYNKPQIYKHLSKLMSSIYQMNDKRSFFEAFIINLWEESRLGY